MKRVLFIMWMGCLSASVSQAQGTSLPLYPTIMSSYEDYLPDYTYYYDDLHDGQASNLRNGKYWYMYYELANGEYSNFLYVVSADQSIRNGKEYTMIRYGKNDSLYYRQEEDRVYYLQQDGRETLLLDYGLEVGDTHTSFGGKRFRVEETGLIDQYTHDVRYYAYDTPAPKILRLV